MKNLIGEANEMALKHHKGQMYNDEYSYVVHLWDVYKILKNHNVTDESILAAAWLHDIIEDTSVSYNDIKKQFGHEIAEIVYCVTDELGRNRNERHLKSWSKQQDSPKAIIVKQADRLANVQAFDKIDMYKKEYPDFRAALKPFGGLPELWMKLDEIG